MTHHHTPTASGAGHEALAPPLPPVSPYRWLLVGQSQKWLDDATAFLEGQRGPMATWRRVQGLVQVLRLEALAHALRVASVAQPRLTRVLCEPGLEAQVVKTLQFSWPGDGHPPLRLGELEAPFDSLNVPLARAEGLAAEQWLLSGRRRWPRYDWPGATDDSRDAAGHAFQSWADELLTSLGNDALDDVYGIGGSDAADLADQDDHGAGVTPAALRQVAAFILPMDKARPLRLAAAGLDGGETLARITARTPTRWVREGTVQDHPDDRYRMQYAPDRDQPRLGSGQVRLQATLTLDAARWRGRRRLVLELHESRQLPVQALLGDVPGVMAETEVRVTLTGQLNVPAAMLQADAAALAVWLRFESVGPASER